MKMFAFLSCVDDGMAVLPSPDCGGFALEIFDREMPRTRCSAACFVFPLFWRQHARNDVFARGKSCPYVES